MLKKTYQGNNTDDFSLHHISHSFCYYFVLPSQNTYVRQAEVSNSGERESWVEGGNDGGGRWRERKR